MGADSPPDGCGHVLLGSQGECTICVSSSTPQGWGRVPPTPPGPGASSTDIIPKNDLISVNTLDPQKNTLIPVNKPVRQKPLSIISALAPSPATARKDKVREPRTPEDPLSDITPEQITAERRRRLAAVKAERERRAAPRALKSLKEFIVQGWHVTEPATPFDDNWHIDFLCEHIQAQFEDWRNKVENPRAQNCVYNVPPGTMKSRIMSVYFTAWAWLQVPSWKVLCMSANPVVARRDADFTRQLIRSNWYQKMFNPKWSLRPDRDALGNFENGAGGVRRALGWTANLVGERYDAHVYDDPHDPTGAGSEVQRDGVIDRFVNTIGNRLNDPRWSIRMLIMQRVQEADLAGYLLDTIPDSLDDHIPKPDEPQIWRHVNLPAEYEPIRGCPCQDCKSGVTFLGKHDPRTEEFESLHKKRMTISVLNAERKRLGEYGYAGQMQQRPAPAEGGMFRKDWWRHYKPGDELHIRRKILSVDGAMKKTEDGSRNAILVIGEESRRHAKSEGRLPRYYLLECHAFREDILQVVKTIKAVQDRHGRCKALVEDKAMGSSVIELLRKETRAVEGFDPKQDSKDARAHATVPVVEAGRVWLPEGAPWVRDFLHELGMFPFGAYDDRVDALCMGINHFENSRLTSWRPR